MWKTEGSLYVRAGPRWEPAGRLAMFDFDSTLVLHRGYGVVSTELSIAYLAALNRTGWNVVIFTNRSSCKVEVLKPINQYLADLEDAGGSADVYAATARDRNRKPQIGAWEAFLRDRRDGRELNHLERAQAFYCGDAAGRLGDFSPGDRYFAQNIGVRFRVPEQIFGAASVARARTFDTTMLDAPPPIHGRELELELDAARNPHSWAETLGTLDALRGYDVVLMAGSPASGKSYIANQLAQRHNFAVVSNDADGSRCHALAKLHLNDHHNVVVDNTHGTAGSRDVVLRAIRGAKPAASIAVLHITTSKTLALHLDGLRCNSDVSGRTFLLPRVAIAAYWKNVPPADQPWPDVPPADVFAASFAFATGTAPEILAQRFCG